ncbi:hypothetical protein ZHAS_00014866 [Anopheles sinensis]|uniref:Cell cycle regulator Mat89Bb n=1 Tax=Anopheles sinensis TaxID=74873 RepID=A0A084W9G6_ANOSI|nr:hypothetical protein ZHAS_00014866 [Anopheles sinensis]
MYPNADGSDPYEKSHTGDGAADALRASVIRATTDSPMSPPHSLGGAAGGADSTMAAASGAATILLGTGSSAVPIGGLLGTRGAVSGKKMFNTGARSLLDVLATTERTNSQKRIDFSGRLCTPPGQIAKLYPHLGSKDADSGQGRSADVK